MQAKIGPRWVGNSGLYFVFLLFFSMFYGKTVDLSGTQTQVIVIGIRRTRWPVDPSMALLTLFKSRSLTDSSFGGHLDGVGSAEVAASLSTSRLEKKPQEPGDDPRLATTRIKNLWFILQLFERQLQTTGGWVVRTKTDQEAVRIIVVPICLAMWREQCDQSWRFFALWATF